MSNRNRPETTEEVWGATVENAARAVGSGGEKGLSSEPGNTGAAGAATRTPSVSPPTPVLTSASLEKQFQLQAKVNRIERLRTLTGQDPDVRWLAASFAGVLEKAHGRDWAKKVSDWAWLKEFAG